MGRTLEQQGNYHHAVTGTAMSIVGKRYRAKYLGKPV